MKNYMEKRNDRNNEGWGLNFWEDPFEGFFKPVMYADKRGSMRTDIKETENSYVMDVEIPGFDKKDVNVSLKDGYLTISAAKGVDKDEEDKKTRRVIRQERYVGSCQRTFYVGDVKAEDVKCKYESGVLSIEVPKADAKKVEGPHTILIEG